MGFWRQFWRQSANTGAVTPSSRYLAAAMVRPLRQHRQASSAKSIQVVEMGPGTGVITREIARILQPGDALDCYEIDVGFARCLRQRVAIDELFEPVRDSVRVHVMPAQEARLESDAQFVICSVPLNNLSPSAVRDIFATGTRLLGGKGWFTYFEYIALAALKRPFANAAERLRIDGVQRAKGNHGAGATETQLVWANLPPARAVHRHSLTNGVASQGTRLCR
jgi:phospholipid N-methyltransferase